MIKSRAHDLPVAWDGRAVRWRETGSVRTITHFGNRECGGCGSRTEPMDTYVGIVDRPGETTTVQRTKRTRSGRTYAVAVEVPAWPVARLMLYRCGACGTDEVYDQETDELWELDETDYGGDGSWPTQPALF